MSQFKGGVIKNDKHGKLGIVCLFPLKSQQSAQVQIMGNSSEFPNKGLTLPGWNIQEFFKIFTPARTRVRELLFSLIFFSLEYHYRKDTSIHVLLQIIHFHKLYKFVLYVTRTHFLNQTNLINLPFFSSINK